MRSFGLTVKLALGLAALGLCLPPSVLAAGPAAPAQLFSDVKLHNTPKGGTLLGEVRDAQGLAKAKVPVNLYKGGSDGKIHRLAGATTDDQGRFAFANLKGGMYGVESLGGSGAYRVWTPNTAPPGAQNGVLIVSGQGVLRGQQWLATPFGQRVLVVAAGLGIAGGVTGAALANDYKEQRDRALESRNSN
ncbi:MAG: carboxypeptidase-like regulatory domain-containing protein [Planctomycetota bacterium]|jgi:hypothetical protein